MRCPVCGQIPPRGANFCFACGTSLARSCPRCQAGQSPEARFCPECDTRLPARPGDAPEPLDEGLGSLDEAVEYTRGRESRRRVAGLAGAFLLVLIVLGGSALWLRPGRRPVTRVPASAAPVVASEPLAAPEPLTVASPLPTPASIEAEREEPATEQRSSPQQSEAAVPARSPSASPRALRPEIGVRDVRIEIAAERRPSGVTEYSVRLRERDGTPVSGAAVSVRGRRADGMLVEASLDPTPEPGVYQAALRLAEITDARLRVVRAGVVKDVRLPE